MKCLHLSLIITIILAIISSAIVGVVHSESASEKFSQIHAGFLNIHQQIPLCRGELERPRINLENIRFRCRIIFNGTLQRLVRDVDVILNSSESFRYHLSIRNNFLEEVKFFRSIVVESGQLMKEVNITLQESASEKFSQIHAGFLNIHQQIPLCREELKRPRINLENIRFRCRIIFNGTLQSLIQDVDRILNSSESFHYHLSIRNNFLEEVKFFGSIVVESGQLMKEVNITLQNFIDTDGYYYNPNPLQELYDFIDLIKSILSIIVFIVSSCPRSWLIPLIVFPASFLSVFRGQIELFELLHIMVDVRALMG